jgi:hypothetical protein
LYIDDRHTGELILPSLLPTAYQELASAFERHMAAASAAIFFVCYTLVSLGYFIGLDKSVLFPRQVVPYLGFDIDSREQAFRILPTKREKFCSLLRSVLSSSFIDQKTLQRLCGKCNSLSLVVPGACMFTNEINLAISIVARSSRPISLVGPLRAEIESWAFLENWRGSLPWRSEFHHQLVLFSDASSSGWGGLLNPGALSVCIRDYWQHTHSTLDINSKEILALANVLDSFSSTISNSWVDAFTDSQVLLQSWSRQGAKSPNVIVV